MGKLHDKGAFYDSQQSGDKRGGKRPRQRTATWAGSVVVEKLGDLLGHNHLKNENNNKNEAREKGKVKVSPQTDPLNCSPQASWVPSKFFMRTNTIVQGFTIFSYKGSENTLF